LLMKKLDVIVIFRESKILNKFAWLAQKIFARFENKIFCTDTYVTHLKSIYFITPRFLLQIYRKSWREVGTGTNCSTSGPNGEDEAAGRLGICINNSLRWPMMLQEWIVRLILTLCRKYDVLNDICSADEVYQK